MKSKRWIVGIAAAVIVVLPHLYIASYPLAARHNGGESALQPLPFYAPVERFIDNNPAANRLTMWWARVTGCEDAVYRRRFWRVLDEWVKREIWHVSDDKEADTSGLPADATDERHGDDFAWPEGDER